MQRMRRHRRAAGWCNCMRSSRQLTTIRPASPRGRPRPMELPHTPFPTPRLLRHIRVSSGSARKGCGSSWLARRDSSAGVGAPPDGLSIDHRGPVTDHPDCGRVYQWPCCFFGADHLALVASSDGRLSAALPRTSWSGGSPSPRLISILDGAYQHPRATLASPCPDSILLQPSQG